MWMPKRASSFCADRDALRPVVVAGDHHGGHLPRAERVEQFVKQRDGFGGGDRPVVEVAGDQEAVRFVPVDRGQQAFKQEMALVLDEAAPVEQPAEVQVCNVQEFQGKSPSFAVRAAPFGWAGAARYYIFLKTARRLFSESGNRGTMDGASGPAPENPVYSITCLVENEQ